MFNIVQPFIPNYEPNPWLTSILTVAYPHPPTMGPTQPTSPRPYHVVTGIPRPNATSA